MIYENIFDLIGHTPIIKYQGLFIKLESFNLAGSIKDRVANQMIEQLIKENKIERSSTVIEVTSGNTGIAIAMFCALKRLKCIIIMLDNVNQEKIRILKAYGAEVLLTPADKGMPYAFEIAKTLSEEKGYIYLNQFDNYQNIIAHEQTAQEIIDDFEEKGLSLDYLVCGMGTCGTIVGIAKVLKKHFPTLKVIGVEPQELSYYSKLKQGEIKEGEIIKPLVHGIQGIGSNFTPGILEIDLIDEVKTVNTKEGYNTFKDLGKHGLLLGLSSSAVYKVAKEIKNNNQNANVLMISADNGLKYLGDVIV